MVNTFHNPLVTLHEVTLGLLAQEEPDSVLDAILDQAVEFTHAISGSIALLNDERKELIIRSHRGLEFDISDKVRLRLGQGVTGRCVLTGKTRNVGDTRQDPHYVEVRSDILSELAIPLKVGSKTFGVLSVDSSSPNAFHDEHEEYLTVLASYAAQIFTNQQALKNLVHRTQIQDLLLEVNTFLGQYPTFKDLFYHSIELLRKKIGLQRTAVYLYQEVSQELLVADSMNYSDEEILRGHYRAGEGITGKVFARKKAIAIADISRDENFLNKSEKKRKGEKISFFASPIILHNEARGVFNMEIPYTSKSHFEDYTFLVQLLSSLFSQAMQIQELIESEKSEIEYQNIVLKRQLDLDFSLDNLIGNSPRMQELFTKIRMVADTSSSVLLLGESGTGKELIATALHRNSIRASQNLVKINCAAIPSELLESELFGYVKGAFSGAAESRKGKFLLAHKGTLFLDEIGEMDLKLQAKILRVLQEKEFSPLGSEQNYQVDVRIIAATNSNLEDMVRKQTFRQDLYYRLNVIRLDIPPLRERKEDIALLARYLAQKIAAKHGKKTPDLNREALLALEEYPFPGNVRELENILERAIVLSRENQIRAEHLSLQAPLLTVFPDAAAISTQTQEQQPTNAQLIGETKPFAAKDYIRQQIGSGKEGEYLHAVLAPLEKDLILYLLEKNLYNKSKTARQLGINRLTLEKKIKEHDLFGEHE